MWVCRFLSRILAQIPMVDNGLIHFVDSANLEVSIFGLKIARLLGDAFTSFKSFSMTNLVFLIVGNRNVKYGIVGNLGETVIFALRRAGCKGFSNMAIGYNSVDLFASSYCVAFGKILQGMLIRNCRRTSSFIFTSQQLEEPRKRMSSLEQAYMMDGFLICLSRTC
ncbi:hypothetical protein RJ641_025279 [Dillenia turbinata]|uniref:Uncharacterized protein n=1 Tax=Dillenia turbinata TaxID=194707 RepID=A0AAN8ZNS2_9MAGN